MGCIFRPEALSWEDIDGGRGEMTMEAIRNFISEYCYPDEYAFERRGIRLVRMENCYQLCSAPDYADIIRKAFEIRKPAKLSQPALEVLTIIA